MYTFNEYRAKFCGPFCDRVSARKMWNNYLEVTETSDDMEKEEVKTPINPWPSATGTTTSWMIIDDICSLAPNAPMQEKSVPCQKKEKTMYVDNDKHIESSKINYLNDRASQVYHKKVDSFYKTFGLTDDDAPTSVEDFIKRIQDGKFIVRDESKKTVKGYYYRPLEGIRWRDPAVKEDKDGFEAACDALKVVYQDTKDAIAIGTPAEGLAAVKALDAWTPTVGNA